MGGVPQFAIKPLQTYCAQQESRLLFGYELLGNSLVQFVCVNAVTLGCDQENVAVRIPSQCDPCVMALPPPLWIVRVQTKREAYRLRWHSHLDATISRHAYKPRPHHQSASAGAESYRPCFTSVAWCPLRYLHQASSDQGSVSGYTAQDENEALRRRSPQNSSRSKSALGRVTAQQKKT